MDWYIAEMRDGKIRPIDALHQLGDEFDTLRSSCRRIAAVCQELEPGSDASRLAQSILDTAAELQGIVNRARMDEKRKLLGEQAAEKQRV